jgi:hypothetical protein
MTHPNLFNVRLLAALTTGTRRVLAGTDIQLDAHTAADLIRSGRARLADEADLAPLLDLVRGRDPLCADVCTPRT